MVAAEDVDGRGADVTTTEQPRSPLRQDRGEVAEHADLEAAEQQMVLIHEEYKKLLREKEVLHYTDPVPFWCVLTCS